MATDSSGLVPQQRDACDRMINALNDVIRQEQEVRKRVEAKKTKLAELRRQRESGDVVQPSHIDQKQQILAQLNKEVEELELAYKYHTYPLPRAHPPRPLGEVSADLPPPVPPRTTNRAAHPVPKDIGMDQWLCMRCSTVNNNLMPFCANPACTK